MEKSVLSRFQGGLLGSMMAETLIKNNPLQTGNKLQEIRFHFLNRFRVANLDEREWMNFYSDEMFPCQNTLSSSEMALVTLPLALLFYDNPILFKEILEKIGAIWLEPKEVIEDVLIWGKAIAYLLQGKPATNNFIARILELEEKLSTPLIEDLKVIQKLLPSQTGLEQVKSILSRSNNGSRAIAYTLYYFSYTPEDFPLTVKRAVSQTTSSVQITAALTGAMAGVYNSYSGIPVSWRLALKQNLDAEEIFQYAKRLFAWWCGVYLPEKTDLDLTVPCYSTRVIQIRPQLKIISQK